MNICLSFCSVFASPFFLVSINNFFLQRSVKGLFRLSGNLQRDKATGVTDQDHGLDLGVQGHRLPGSFCPDRHPDGDVLNRDLLENGGRLLLPEGDGPDRSHLCEEENPDPEPLPGGGGRDRSPVQGLTPFQPEIDARTETSRLKKRLLICVSFNKNMTRFLMK